MGLFDLFRKKTPNNGLPKNEKKEAVEKITFSAPDQKAIEAQASAEAEKIARTDKLSNKSEHGLTVSQILLLSYCKKGKYPNPEGGYQRFWWFEYGVKNVGDALKQLETGGFIRYTTPSEALQTLKVDELKKILESLQLTVSGKKATLIERITQSVNDEILSRYIKTEKYTLTELGEKEVQSNDYIPYLHAHKYPEVSVWDVNYHADPKHWRDYVWGKFNQCSMEYAANGQWGLYRNARFSMAEFLTEETKYADAFAMYGEVCFYDVNGMDIYVDYDSPSDLLIEGIITRMNKVAKEGGLDESQKREILSKRIKSCQVVKRRVPKGEMTDLILRKMQACL